MLEKQLQTETDLLLNQMSTLNYPKYLIRSHEQTILPPAEFDVSTQALHVIIRFLLTDAVPVFSQYIRNQHCEISSDLDLIKTFYEASQMLGFVPKICPEAFTDRLPG